MLPACEQRRVPTANLTLPASCVQAAESEAVRCVVVPKCSKAVLDNMHNHHVGRAGAQ